MICVSVVRYNAATSDVNHVRLLERRSRAYTCRELMCIVFLPCLLICLLGIACSALVIYYQLDKVGKWVKDGLGGGVYFISNTIVSTKIVPRPTQSFRTFLKNCPNKVPENQTKDF